MSSGHVPQAWKQATVTPVFKGGIASDPSNYRPISLTSVFSKLMERVVVLDMLRYCKEQGLISKQQHGFLARKSTVTNMLSCNRPRQFATNVMFEFVVCNASPPRPRTASRLTPECVSSNRYCKTHLRCSGRVGPLLSKRPVSYTHLTLPTILRV